MRHVRLALNGASTGCPLVRLVSVKVVAIVAEMPPAGGAVMASEGVVPTRTWVLPAGTSASTASVMVSVRAESSELSGRTSR